MGNLNNLIGKGIVFPIKLVGGTPPLATGEELINSSLRSIISWPILTRLMNASFGSLVDNLIEEPNDSFLKSLIEEILFDAIVKHEKRITLRNLKVTNSVDSKLTISINYIIKGSKIEGSLTYPYYKTLTE